MVTSHSVEPRSAVLPKENDLAANPRTRAVDSSGLFQGQREICIEHDGVQYRLRITRRNKLILHK